MAEQSNQHLREDTHWSEQGQIQQEGAVLLHEKHELESDSGEFSREIGAVASRSWLSAAEMNALWRANIEAGHQEEEQNPAYANTVSRNPVAREETLTARFH